MRVFFFYVVIWKYWNTAFWFYCFITILLLEAVLWVRKMKMKHCLFYTKKRFYPCWIKHFDSIKGKYFGIFKFLHKFDVWFWVFTSQQIAVWEPQNLLQGRKSGVSRVFLWFMKHPFEHVLLSWETQRITKVGLYCATAEYNRYRESSLSS